MMARVPDDGLWFDPKWFVIGVALVALGLVISYDLRLGAALGVLEGVVVAGWLYLLVRFRPRRGDVASIRGALVSRLGQHSRNRSAAAQRESEAASSRSGPQDGPDPA